MTIDDYGRVTVAAGELFNLLYARGDLQNIFVEPGPVVARFNELCIANDKRGHLLQTLPELDHTPADEHGRRRNTWHIQPEWAELDIRAYVLSLCDSDEENQRVLSEMVLFEERDMLPILRLMAMLVNHFRANNVIWGIGRGSSTASFVLYKLGVHKINSLRYNLDIGEFLR